MALLELFCLIVVTSIAFNGMMFLMMVRVDDPLVPRAMFGVLNTAAALSLGRHVSDRRVSRLAAGHLGRRSVHLLRSRLQGGPAQGRRLCRPFSYDLLFLFVFGIGTLLIATPLFKRTL